MFLDTPVLWFSDNPTGDIPALASGQVPLCGDIDSEGSAHHTLVRKDSVSAHDYKQA